MRVLYPPRPASRIAPGELPELESANEWVAQYKFNGERNLICIRPSGLVEFFNRRGEKCKTFSVTDAVRKQLLSLNLERGIEYWLDSELLLNKTSMPMYKGKIVLFDILFAGRYLFGSNQMDRLNHLSYLCHRPVTKEPYHGIGLQVTDQVLLAEVFDNHFVDRFHDFIDLPVVEGLLLRKRKSKLDNIGTRPYDVAWQLRCRKPHRTYRY